MALKNAKAKPIHKLSRKQQRKEKRKEKKVRRNEFFSKKKSASKPSNQDKPLSKNNQDDGVVSNKQLKNNTPKNKENTNKVLNSEQIRIKEKKEQKKLEADMKKQRNKQLLEANKEEDKIIRQMEKQLGLKKRKSKSIPKSFAEDGLDFLLEVVDPEYLKQAKHQEIDDTNNEFEEDFALMSGKKLENKSKVKKGKDNDQNVDESDDDVQDFDDFEEQSVDDEYESIEEDDNEELEENSEEDYNEEIENNSDVDNEENNCDEYDSEEEINLKSNKLAQKNISKDLKSSKRKLKEGCKSNKKQKISESENYDENSIDSDDSLLSNDDFDIEKDDEEEFSEDEPQKTLKDSKINKKRKLSGKSNKNSIESGDNLDSDDDFDTEINDEEEYLEDEAQKTSKDSKRIKKRKLSEKSDENSIESEDNLDSDDDFDTEINDDEEFSEDEPQKASKDSKRNKKRKLSENSTISEDNLDSGDNFDAEYNDEEEFSEDEPQISKKGAVKQFPDGTWEDIYGRLRGKDGSILTKDKAESKYVPPALREQMTKLQPVDKKRLEKLNRLKKQLKGLLNRLAESNMHSIASQIEDLYMNNSRNDMNETLTNLIMDSLVAEVLTPERLLIEHIVLLAVLHANVGTEVGAHFLQHVIKQFNEHLNKNDEVENKTLDNIVCVIAQLYNFKLFDAKLMYEVLQKLAENFKEKDVECILHVLKSVGFTLRKEDPLALKNLILDLQNRANSATEEERDNPRVKFMLDILLAIKNNNVTKIPNYDISYPEHLKKVMKSFIRKGNYVTTLNISLEDLLKAEERGRWWVVGSAWTGNNLEPDNSTKVKTEGFSSKLLELAKKQRMNTDIRRNIFCIIMSAEDYLDAFEKLLKLGLKHTQEREIINIILHCCLQEKSYNPYYGFLAQKFCDFDRKYQLTIKYSIWDKLKAIGDHSGSQLSNLAKLLIHLFIEKGLPISILKIVQFGELDKVTLRFIRQILLGILLHKDIESTLSVFARVAQSDKLKLFRESLRLFIHHFLLRNLKTDKVPEDEKQLIETRVKIVEKVLTSKTVT